MTTVMIYEAHAAVLSGLRIRLEAEAAISVSGAFSDPIDFAEAVARFTPDIAVVSGFGPGAIQAANLARGSRPETRLLALVPGLRRHERVGYPAGDGFVDDGPRGDRLVKRLLHLGSGDSPIAASA